MSPSFAREVSETTLVEPLIAKAHALKLFKDKQWLRLLHYQESLFGGIESRADAPVFFAAVDGSLNPRAELSETIRAFFDENSTEMDSSEENNPHGQCLFPARKKWLMQKLNLNEDVFPKVHCPRLEKFRQIAEAESASLIFSSYFMGNPSSTFGHTFLRLNKPQKGAKTT